MLYDINGNKLSGESVKSEKSWKDNGVLDSTSVAKQLCEVEWTTTESGMPIAFSGSYSEGQTTQGMPYSSASTEDGYIGIGISLYTFMSAVHNPKSVLYTRQSKGYTGVAYYGTVCTSLICSAWGIPCLITTVAFPKSDIIQQLDSLADVEVGDMILSGTHAKLILSVIRDASGSITSVQTAESIDPNCKETLYSSYSSFASAHSAYTAYRYKKIDEVKSYQPSPYLRLYDEEEKQITYPDIMTVFGDKVTRKYGTDVEINVLESTGYSSIKIYKDGTLIDTKSTVADFTITNPSVGAYEVKLVGTGKESSTYFDIVDCTIDVDGNTATYTTTYSAVAIGGYPTYSTNSSGKATSWNNPKRVHLITDAENIARTVDISEMRADSDCNGGVRLYVKGIYGSVSFEKAYA